MNTSFSYFGRSSLSGQTLNFQPNLARDPVAFDAALKRPQRFREAISALHDIVVSDLRHKKRDKSDYEAWKASEAERVEALHHSALKQARTEVLAAESKPLPPDFEKQFSGHCKTYWAARQTYAEHLRKHDLALWRKLMPCDPVITVAADSVFFECFSADESSYGCLSVNREEGFGACDQVQLGTTNVDYSWDLYHHFQGLRSYRETRFRLDPAGFDVATQGSAEYREEKIDLPGGWLRGFMQLQAAMTMPMRRLTLTREAVYSLLVWLRRHKASTSPRALRFEHLPGQSPALVVEPWEQRIPVHGLSDAADWREPVRIWGRQRLLALARVLPLAESIDVYLLGTGFPSFWIVRMGEMRLTLGLSGWTTNDWTHGSALDLLAPPVEVAPFFIDQLAQQLRQRGAASLSDLGQTSSASALELQAALRHLAHTGQLIHDLPAGLFRWRQIMPRALGEAELGPEDEETSAARLLLAKGRVVVDSRIQAPGGGLIFTGKAESNPVELLLDLDGRIRKGRCLCSHFRKAGLRMGPCRHLQALRWSVAQQTGTSTTGSSNSRDKGFVAQQKGGA